MPSAAASKRVALDASALLAGISEWHPFHTRTAALIEKLFQEKADIVIPEHACVETYSVLTRLPAPYRISPRDAAALLEANQDWFTTVTLPAGRVLWVLDSFAQRGIAGGRIYDALHLEVARSADAVDFVTLNPKHFAGLADDIRIRTL